MREDMDKVLVEKPRRGGCGKQLIRANRHASNVACKMAACDTDIETDDFHSMKRIHSSKGYGNTKELNENLNPLRRFLKSRVGQPWDSVYSEIMKGLNLNNAVQYHVWQHLVEFGEVQTKTYMEGNTVMAAGVLGPEAIKNDSYREEFYVDPRNGTLCCTEVKRQKAGGKSYKDRQKAFFDQSRYIDSKKPLVQWHKVNGIWYEYEFREASEDEKRCKSFGETRAFNTYNPVTGACTGIEERWAWIGSNKFVEQMTEGFRPGRSKWFDALWEVCNDFFEGPYFPISKRQISSQEVKKVENLMLQRKPHKKAA